MPRATGTFEVKIDPVELSPVGKQGELGRMTIDKQFSGGISGTSKGEMLVANTPSDGSMSYVALERVTAEVDGRSGSFVLMHNGVMVKSDPSAGEFRVIVVVGSGTGELTGLSGNMTIRIEGGQHRYEFEYLLP